MKNVIFLSFLLISAAVSAKTKQVFNPTVIKSLTSQWSQAVSDQDLRTLQSLYADALTAYGKKTTRTAVLKSKLDFYLKHSDYSQVIVSTVSVQKLDANQYVSSFVKQYTIDNKTSEVTAYLYFSNVTGNWKIIKETDDVTEKNIEAKKVTKKQTVTTNKPKPTQSDLMKMIEEISKEISKELQDADRKPNTSSTSCSDLADAMLKSTALYKSYNNVEWSEINTKNTVFTYVGTGTKGRSVENLKLLVDTKNGTIYLVTASNEFEPVEFDKSLKSKKCN